jgi:hypothetical protein
VFSSAAATVSHAAASSSYQFTQLPRRRISSSSCASRNFSPKNNVRKERSPTPKLTVRGHAAAPTRRPTRCFGKSPFFRSRKTKQCNAAVVCNSIAPVSLALSPNERVSPAVGMHAHTHTQSWVGELAEPTTLLLRVSASWQTDVYYMPVRFSPHLSLLTLFQSFGPRLGRDPGAIAVLVRSASRLYKRQRCCRTVLPHRRRTDSALI